MSFCYALASTAMGADGVPSLPAWSTESRELVSQEDWLPGADLLTLEAEDGPQAASGFPLPRTEEMGEEASDHEIPDEFLDDYFADRPEGFLVDPQGLLHPSARRDREAFLDYHSADSKIDFYVYVFGPDQQIPGEVRAEEIGERLFTEGKPSLNLFYYLGAPSRAEIFLSPGLTDAVSDAERRRILQSSVLAAAERSDSISQLEAFCVQTSIRIYWIEKAAGLVDESVPAPAESPLARAEPDEPSRLDQWKESFSVFWFHWGAIISVSLSGLMISIGAWWTARRRARYRFPEFDVAPRLGGEHAAGVGAVIGFGSTTKSPSTQHSGAPDYFGGI
ncbi:hypothetical protein ACFQY0_03160 [Haloferula chungangensis]|uniref:Transmembrane protein n=1 Tax=Haloferula chungangensis TaxID=1048331 RepID=A0ABW2L1G8_9BACT